MVTGTQLRDAGIGLALDHANAVIEDWRDLAGHALETYIKAHPQKHFMTEDVRAYAYQILALPHPPHERAWGGVIMSAAKAGQIVRVCLAPVKTPRSHRANATVWRAS